MSLGIRKQSGHDLVSDLQLSFRQLLQMSVVVGGVLGGQAASSRGRPLHSRCGAIVLMLLLMLGVVVLLSVLVVVGGVVVLVVLGL
eukprot:3589673-Pyramimonas_sp.AAC.1